MFILILLISIVLSQDVLAKDIVVLTPHTFEVSKFEGCDIPLQHSFKSNDIKIRKFYLNCTPGCSENKLEHKFNAVWKEILKIDPEYLIIYGNILWDRFGDKIKVFSENHTIGIFGFYGNSNIVDIIDKGTKIFFSVEDVDIGPVLAYFTNNAKKFNNYYIFRDDCLYNLIKAIDLKKQLRQVDSSYNVKIVQVRDLDHLKYSIASIQHEEQGVIITFISQLKSNGKYLDINSIGKNVSLNNTKHILVSLDLDMSEYYHISLISKLYNQEYPVDWFKECDASYFRHFKGDRLRFFYPLPLMVLNTTEISKLYNGYQLLKHMSGFIDVYR